MEFIKFLGHCIWEGWETGDHVFAAIEGFCFVLAAGMLWLKERHHAAHKTWEKVEAWIMKIAFGLMVLVFFGSSLFYVPFAHHKKMEKALETANQSLKSYSNELHEASPGKWEKALNDSKLELETERKAHAKAEEDSRRNRDQGIKWLLASSNSITVMPVLKDAILAAHSDLAAMSTNPKPDLNEFLHKKNELKKLQEVMAFQSKAQDCSQYIAFMNYAISAYEDRFSALIAKCGGDLQLPEIPNANWWGLGSERKDTLSTNCNVIFGYSYRAGTILTTVFSLQGKTKKEARVVFVLALDVPPPILRATFYLGDEALEQRASQLPERAKCVTQIDFVLDLLLSSLKHELQ